MTGMETGHYDVRQYFALVECGIIAPDDRVELLEGVIVAMPPQSPPHASSINRVQYVLQKKLGPDVNLRIQSSFVAGERSVPEPDLALVPGGPDDYCRRHPSKAHLIVEVAESSAIQDRLTKAAVYARAGVPCCWIVNVRDRCVEVFREPDRCKAEYAVVARATGADTFTIDAFPGIPFQAAELLPPAIPDDEP